MSIQVGVSKVQGVWEGEIMTHLVVDARLTDHGGCILELLHEDGSRFWVDYEMVEEVEFE